MKKKKIEEAPPSYKKWWKALNTLCEHFGWGVKTKLQEYTGVTQKHISQVCSGDARASQELMDKIAAFFGVTTAQMMEKGASILEVLNKKSALEPFPGFEEIKKLDTHLRYDALCRLVATKYGLQDYVQAFSDPLYDDERPVLETDEEIIQEYERQDKFWRERAKKFLSMEGVSPERQEAALRYLEKKFKVKIDREAIKEFVAYSKKEEKEGG